MEIKDIFYIIGIVISLIALLVSLCTLLLGFKNRRNSLREHLYKEQMIFFSRFLASVNKLNFEVEGLLNNPDKKRNHEFYEKLDVISNDYYNSEFLLTHEISALIHNHIFKSNQFYICFLSDKDSRTRNAYSSYFDSYTSMLDHVKEFIGTNELSKENKTLHSNKSKVSATHILKLIKEISDKAIGIRI